MMSNIILGKWPSIAQNSSPSIPNKQLFKGVEYLKNSGKIVKSACGSALHVFTVPAVSASA